MFEIEHFEKLLTLLKTIEDDQNININIQRKPWPLNGVDAASQEKSIDIVKRKMYRYFSIRRCIIFIDTFPITTRTVLMTICRPH